MQVQGLNNDPDRCALCWGSAHHPALVGPSAGHQLSAQIPFNQSPRVSYCLSSLSLLIHEWGTWIPKEAGCVRGRNPSCPPPAPLAFPLALGDWIQSSFLPPCPQRLPPCPAPVGWRSLPRILLPWLLGGADLPPALGGPYKPRQQRLESIAGTVTHAALVLKAGIFLSSFSWHFPRPLPESIQPPETHVFQTPRLRKSPYHLLTVMLLREGERLAQGHTASLGNPGSGAQAPGPGPLPFPAASGVKEGVQDPRACFCRCCPCSSPCQKPRIPGSPPPPPASPSHPAGPLSKPLQAGLTVAKALPAVAAVTTASVQGRNHLMPGGQWPRHPRSSPGDLRLSGSCPDWRPIRSTSPALPAALGGCMKARSDVRGEDKPCIFL